YNFYPCTMPWVNLESLTLLRNNGVRQISIFHETPITGFDAYVYPDPTFVDCSRQLNDWYGMGRPLPKALDLEKEEGQPTEMPVIGSAGFGFDWKGHARLVEQVLKEFPRALIRLHIPFAAFGDADGANARRI